jgi:predicted metal-dependent phosphoesterase TrpH
MSAKFVRAEFHCHTEYSYDGMIRFEGMLRTAIRRGLDAIAITDHDTIEGALEFRARAKRLNSPVHIIVGEECTLANRAHLIGLFLHSPIQSSSLEDAVAEIREQGGVCIVPHPFRGVSGVLTSNPEIAIEDLCFEIFNSRCSPEVNAAAHCLSERQWLPVGGSDAHVEADLGKTVNVVPFCDGVEKSIRRALGGAVPLAVYGTTQAPGEDKGRRQRLRDWAWQVERRASTFAPRIVRRAHRLARNMFSSDEINLELKIPATDFRDRISSLHSTAFAAGEGDAPHLKAKS